MSIEGPTFSPIPIPLLPVADRTKVFAEVDKLNQITQNFLTSLQGILNSLAQFPINAEVPSIHPPQEQFPNIPNPPQTPSTPSDLNNVDSLFNGIQLPNTPIHPTSINPNFPHSDLREPTISVPSAPILAHVLNTPAAPSISYPTAPTEPTVTLPPVPTLDSLNLPTPPNIALPSPPGFTLTVDPDTLLSSLSSFDYPSTLSSIKKSLPPCKEINGLVAKIEEMLLGGTGLPATVENQILDRSVDKIEKEGLRARNQLMVQFSSRGFTMPGAQLLSGLADLAAKTLEAKQAQIRDNTIYIHEKYLESLRFAIQSGVQLQGIYFEHCVQVLSLCNNIAQGILETAKTILTARIEILRSQIAVFQAQVEAYRTAVQAELSKLEAYRGQLEAERLRGELNEQKIRIYTAQLQALTTSVEIYKAKVAAYEAKLRAEVSKIEVFRAQIEANNAIVQQNRARVETYDAQIRAEVSKVQAFESRVRAYIAQVQGEAARVQALISTNESQLKQRQLETDIYAKQIDAAISKVQAKIAVFNAHVEEFKNQLNAYSVQVDGLTKQSQQKLDMYKIDSDVALKNAEVLLEKIKATLTLTLEKFKALAQYNAQVGAAALAAVNTSIGYHAQETVSSNISAVNQFEF
jgi:hypothetical protein